jgi:hypothetical protein
MRCHTETNAPGRKKEAIKLSAQGWLIFAAASKQQCGLLVHNNLCLFLPDNRRCSGERSASESCCVCCRSALHALPLTRFAHRESVSKCVCSLWGLKIFPYATGNRNFSLLEGHISCREAKLINANQVAKGLFFLLTSQRDGVE